MRINQRLTLLPNLFDPVDDGEIDHVLQEANSTFGQLLGDASVDVRRLQLAVVKAMELRGRGDAVDLGVVVDALRRARVSFWNLQEARTRSLSVYRELMRIDG